jgi:hypothetical protein
MAITMWQRGRRLFSTSAMLMILTAVGHTAGFLLGGSSDPADQRVVDAMRERKNPLGMGMNPSVYDIYWDLVLTMSITFAALGLINLLIAATPSASSGLLRKVGWANALWLAAFLVLNVALRIPPSLISGGITELTVIAFLLTSRRATAG